MINLSDPLDRLRAANPVLRDDPTLPPPGSALFREITAPDRAGAVGWAQRRRRRARRVVPVILIGGLLGGATAYGLLRGGVTKPQTVACYESADPGANLTGTAVGTDGPIAACAELWRRGKIGDGGPVPPLVECVLDSGVAGVFPAPPGSDVCARLNLPSPPSTAAPPTPAPGPASSPAPGADLSARISAFRDAVAPTFVESPCVEPNAAVALVRRELDRAGLTDWTIRSGDGPGGGFNEARPCASYSLRPETKEVVLAAFPRR